MAPSRRRALPARLTGTQRVSSNHNQAEQQEQFRSLNASLLYCPRCRVATPTRERLLLVLPSGNLYEYLCMQCGTSTGSKTDNQDGMAKILRP